jgi:hypothetical protein
LGEDLRRFSIEVPCKSVFEALCVRIQTIYSPAFASGKLPVIKYRDDEGDAITITSDEELEEAIRAANGGLIRLVLIAPPVTPSSAPVVTPIVTPLPPPPALFAPPMCGAPFPPPPPPPSHCGGGFGFGGASGGGSGFGGARLKKQLLLSISL